MALKLISNVLVKYVSSDEIIYNSAYLHEYWGEIIPVHSIHLVYCVKAIVSNTIIVLDTSLSEKKKTNFIY